MVTLTLKDPKRPKMTLKQLTQIQNPIKKTKIFCKVDPSKKLLKSMINI